MKKQSVDRDIKEAGNSLLPNYSMDFGPTGVFFEKPLRKLANLLDNSLINMLKGKKVCKKFYQDNNLLVDKPPASHMLNIVEYAWMGHATDESSEYKSLPKSAIPKVIQVV